MNRGMAAFIVRWLPAGQPRWAAIHWRQPELLAGLSHGRPSRLIWLGFPRMSLDPATVRRIAKLARIRLEPEEVPRLQGELNNILGWIDELLEVNVDRVEPMSGGHSHVAEREFLRVHTDAAVNGPVLPKGRPDVVTDGGYAEKILANAPDRAGEFFAVPKVVE